MGENQDLICIQIQYLICIKIVKSFGKILVSLLNYDLFKFLVMITDEKSFA